jgi:hypothetical protein
MYKAVDQRLDSTDVRIDVRTVQMYKAVDRRLDTVRLCFSSTYKICCRL